MRAWRMRPAVPKRLRRRRARRASAEAAAEAMAEAAQAAAEAAQAAAEAAQAAAEAAQAAAEAAQAAAAPRSPGTAGGEAPLVVTLPEATEGACAVCRDEWQAGAQVRVLPCAHRFHAACVGAWLGQYKAECPLCRARVPERAAPRAPGRARGLFLELGAHGPGLGAALALR